MIEAEGIVKRFGNVQALGGVSLSCPYGRVLALLGPNGSGKTTMVRILSTLLRPDTGRASVAGFDIVEQAAPLRSMIGLAGQYAAVDELLTGRENLELVGLWYHLERTEYRRRAEEALEQFGLAEAGDRLVKTYSGGMRRRLDIAASLVGRPPVVFLDEPTTGLDPRTRNELWGFVEGLVAAGTTVLLTTQYMEEAERLADTIVVLDRGQVIARGSADELKAQVGGDTLEIRVAHPGDLARAAAVLAEMADVECRTDPDHQRVSVATGEGIPFLMAVGQRMEQEGIPLDDLGIRRPSLEDVFLSLIGTGVDADQPAPAPTAVATP